MALSVFASLESGEIRANKSNYLDVVIALGLRGVLSCSITLFYTGSYNLFLKVMVWVTGLSNVTNSYLMWLIPMLFQG